MAKLDQHFTSDEVSKRLVELSSVDNYDLIVEPSAGGGAISNLLPREKTLAFDIEPQLDYIIEQDYTKFQFAEEGYKNILVIGNPPFGYRAQLAVEFFNISAEYADTIAMILPRSFRKAYVIDQLAKLFHLELDESVDVGSFSTDTKVRCCLQIWKRKSYQRPSMKYTGDTDDFTPIPQGKGFDPLQCDIAVRRTGYGEKVGELVDVSDALPITQFIFLNVADKTVIDNLKSIGQDLYKYSYDTTAISPTFTIKELIYVYNQRYGSANLHNLLK